MADATTDPHAQDEAAVLAAVLAQEYGASFYVIRDRTLAFSLESEDSSAELADLQTIVPDLSVEMVASFCVRSATEHPLSPDMDLGAPYQLVSEQEMHEIFSAKDVDGWQRFREKYPDAPGDLAFTRVGFNSTQDEALLWWRFQWDWLAGVGGFILLDRIDGAWRVADRVETLRS